MSRVLLVQPPGYFQFPPLGLLKLAALRRMKGDSVHLIMPEIIYTKSGKLKRQSNRTQSNYMRYKVNNLDFVPDTVYVTSLFTWDWPYVHETVEWIRRKNPKVPIYLGGIYTTLMPNHAKKSGARIKTGLVDSAENLMPAYDLIPDWNSSIGFSSRGCVNKCAFCAVPRLEPTFEAEKSIKHFLYPGHKGIVLFDNNFLASPYWKKILDEIAESKRWVDINQGLDFRLLDKEKAKALLKTRLLKGHFKTAIDSVDDIAPVEDAARMLVKYGLKWKRFIMAYMLFNFTDTPDDFLKRLKAGMKAGITMYPMRYQPMKGEHALTKDSYISPHWNARQLELVADARRIMGWGGAFVPTQEFFLEQVKNAECLEDALHFTRRGRSPKTLKNQTQLPDF